MDDRTTVIDGVLVELKHEVDLQFKPGERVIALNVETPTVDKTLATFHRQWNKTADECIKRAVELEAEAVDLRSRANSLINSCDYLTEVRQTVLFEIESRNRAMSLALVNPKDHD